MRKKSCYTFFCYIQFFFSTNILGIITLKVTAGFKKNCMFLEVGEPSGDNECKYKGDIHENNRDMGKMTR